MPRFVDPTAEQAFNKTGASRGQLADRSAGQLFETLGDGVSGLVETADTFIKNSIRDEVEQASDNLDQEFGVSSASLFETDVGSSNQPRPEALERAGTQLQDLRQAAANGSLSETNYYMRVDSMVRQLRSRFPGHRDDIDGIVSDVINAPAANQVRRALFAEMANSDDEQLKREGEIRRFLLKHSDFAPPEALENILTLSGQELQDAFTSTANAQAQFQSIRRDAEQAANRRLEEGDTEDAQFEDASRLISSSYAGDLTLALDRPIPGLEDKTMRMLLAQPSASLTEDERALISDAWNVFRTGELQKVSNLLLADFPDMPIERQNQIKENIISNLDFFERQLDDENFGVLGGLERYMQFESQSTTIKLLESSEALRTAKAIEDAFGSEILGLVFGQNENFLGLLHNQAQGFSQARSSSNRLTSDGILKALDPNLNMSISTIHQEIITLAPREAAEVIEGINTGLARVLLNEETPTNVKLALAQRLYTADASQVIELFPNPVDRRRVFDTLVNPEATASYASSRGTPDGDRIWNSYAKFVTDQFNSLSFADFNTISEIEVQSNQINVDFDKETFQFSVSLPNQGRVQRSDFDNDFSDDETLGDVVRTLVDGVPVILGAAEDRLLFEGTSGDRGAVGAVNNINQYLERFVPVMREHFKDQVPADQLDARIAETLIQSQAGFVSTFASEEEERMNNFLTRTVFEPMRRELQEVDDAFDRTERKRSLRTSAGPGNPQESGQVQGTSGGEPVRGSILDVIASVEATSTAQGDEEYNSRNGNKLIDGLSQLSISEAIEQGGTGAIGRYQFIPSTLNDIISRHSDRFSLEDTFNKETQDAMATVLLEEAGLQDYLDGKTDTTDFANRIARVWAGFPVLSDINGVSRGDSYYKGVQDNKAGMTAEEAENFLIQLRENQ